jgi:hypothetical protein
VYKVIIDQGATRCNLSKPISSDQLLETLVADGFRFPTEDEFEDFCGGGKSTLYRWEEVFQPESAWQLQMPRRMVRLLGEGWIDQRFGVAFGFDASKSEVVIDSEVLGKGGEIGDWIYAVQAGFSRSYPA